MITIAQICAYAPKMNYGMLTVDLAFDDFLKSCGLEDCKVDSYSVEEAHSLYLNVNNSLDYKLVTNPELELSKYDYIILWGDFLTSHEYIYAVARRIARKRSIDINEAIDLSYKNLLFEGVSSKLKQKIMILSSTLITNTNTILDSRYNKAVHELYRECKLIAPRDPISLYLSIVYAGNSTRVIQGVDASLFLDSNRYFGNRKISETTNTLGFSFSRTAKFSKRHPWKYIKARGLVRNIARHIKCHDTINIDWNTDDNNSKELSAKILTIRKCRLILTDTYHCAINSWREGVPAICVGIGSKKQIRSTDDKKKEIFYLSIQASQYYLYWENFCVFNQYPLSNIEDEEKTKIILNNLVTQKKVYARNVYDSINSDK